MPSAEASTLRSTAGSTAKSAAKGKLVKYEDLSQRHAFVPIAIQSHGTFSKSTLDFLHELELRAPTITLDPEKLAFCFNIYLSLHKDLMLFVSPTLLSPINC